MGIGPAIIQYKDLTETDLDSIFTATLILGLVLGGVFFVSSWTIANFYDNQLLVPICQILAVNLLMNSANLVPNSLMMRDLRFKFVATRSLILQIISGIFAIIVAYYGWSVYALVIPPIFTSICVCYQSVLLSTKNRLAFQSDSAEENFLIFYISVLI